MIRSFHSEDTDKLVALWLETSVSAHPFISEEYWRKNVGFVRTVCLPQAQTYVFEDKHQLKGFISVLDKGHVGALFVGEKYQGQKIGGKLMNFVKKRFSHLTLNVYVKNIRAVSFYQKCGFKIISEQTDTSTEEIELVMSWALGCKSGFQKRFQGDS